MELSTPFSCSNTIQAAKKIVARFEGHGDTKKIAHTSQFIAGGLAGMFSQYVILCLAKEGITDHEQSRGISTRHIKIVCPPYSP